MFIDAQTIVLFVVGLILIFGLIIFPYLYMSVQDMHNMTKEVIYMAANGIAAGYHPEEVFKEYLLEYYEGDQEAADQKYKESISTVELIDTDEVFQGTEHPISIMDFMGCDGDCDNCEIIPQFESEVSREKVLKH